MERGLSFEGFKLDGEGTFCLKISSWMERGLSFEDLKLDGEGTFV